MWNIFWWGLESKAGCSAVMASCVNNNNIIINHNYYYCLYYQLTMSTLLFPIHIFQYQNRRWCFTSSDRLVTDSKFFILSINSAYLTDKSYSLIVYSETLKSLNEIFILCSMYRYCSISFFMKAALHYYIIKIFLKMLDPLNRMIRYECWYIETVYIYIIIMCFISPAQVYYHHFHPTAAVDPKLHFFLSGKILKKNLLQNICIGFITCDGVVEG